MQLDDLLQELRLRFGDILDGLARNRFRQEADEVRWMTCLQGHPDLALGLEAADPGTVAGTRIDDDEGAVFRIQPLARRWFDAHQNVIDRSFERPAVHDEILFSNRKLKHMRSDLR